MKTPGSLQHLEARSLATHVSHHNLLDNAVRGKNSLRLPMIKCELPGWHTKVRSECKAKFTHMQTAIAGWKIKKKGAGTSRGAAARVAHHETCLLEI